MVLRMYFYGLQEMKVLFSHFKIYATQQLLIVFLKRQSSLCKSDRLALVKVSALSDGRSLHVEWQKHSATSFSCRADCAILSV